MVNENENRPAVVPSNGMRIMLSLFLLCSGGPRPPNLIYNARQISFRDRFEKELVSNIRRGFADKALPRPTQLV
jgi:hypothetical protein